MSIQADPCPTDIGETPAGVQFVDNPNLPSKTTFTPKGTKITYAENGRIASQEAPAAIWDIPARETLASGIQRFQKATAKPIEALQNELDVIHENLGNALSTYEANKDTDRFAQEKRDLRMYLAEHEAKVRQARERLTTLETAPTPAAELANNIAELEIKTSRLGREVQLTLASAVAEKVYDQPFNDLTVTTQREIYRRKAITALQHIATTLFHTFSRLEVQTRSVTGAKTAAVKIKNALDSIAKALSK